MPFREPGWSKARTELLMDITASLGNLTQKAEDFSRIPVYLSQTLNLGPLSLAIIRSVPDGAMVLLSAFSEGPAPASLEQDLLNIHQQTKARPPQEDHTPQSPIDIEQSELDVTNLAAYPRATVFAHAIDARHRMLLIVHQRAGKGQVPAGLTEALQLVARQLCRLLESLVFWMTRPNALGGPFHRLTEREWIVLRGLISDAGEKQLADQLGMSPHTLHSHIKAIYRKVGVQGRLSLLLQVGDVMRELRLSRLNGHVMPAEQQGMDRVVTVG